MSICVYQRRRRLPAEKQLAAAPGGVFRPYAFNTCRTLEDCSDAPEYPVECTITHGETKEVSVVRSKYLLGCDGARSLVRKAMAGGGDGDGEWAGKIRMEGAATDIIWGVVDAAVRSELLAFLFHADPSHWADDRLSFLSLRLSQPTSRISSRNA